MVCLQKVAKKITSVHIETQLLVSGGYGPLKKMQKPAMMHSRDNASFVCFGFSFSFAGKHLPLQFLKYISLIMPFVINGHSGPAEVSSFGP